MKYVVIALKGTYCEIGGQVQSISAPKKLFRLDRLMELCAWIKKKRSIGTVLMIRHPDFLAPSFGALESIHALVRDLSQHKELWYYATDYDLIDIYLASACTNRIIHPLGTLCLRGLAWQQIFFKKLLDKHGVEVEVFRRGSYKSAADPFRCDSLDQYNREQLERLLEVTFQTLSSEIMQDSAYSQQLMDSLLGGETLTAADAVAKQLVTEAVSEHELRNRWKKNKVSELVKKRYKGVYGSGTRIAVLVFEGAIVDGSNREDALMGQCIGDDFMVKHIRKLREKKRIKGVVFRINSGGGSATASESIQRELRLLAAEKPLVVSIGPIAASGGYWISTSGHRVFAQATSITGSIGVIMLHMSMQRPLEHLGLDHDSVKQGEFADFGSALRSLSQTERDVLEQMTEYYYQEFLQLVGNARSMSPEQVHTYAEGRLWTGVDALEHGLIDQVGGLQEALSHLAQTLNKETLKIEFHPVVKQPWLVRMVNSNMEKDQVTAFSPHALVKSCRMLQGRPLSIDPLWFATRNDVW